MYQINKKDPFTLKMYRKLWWPALLSAIGLSMGDMADALVIGRRMGESGLAAVSLCLPLYMVINVFIYGLGTGGSIRYAKLLSEGKPDEAEKNFNHLLFGGALIGAAVMAVIEIFIYPVMTLLGTSPEDGIIFERALTYARLIALSIPIFIVSYILNYYLITDDNEKIATAGYIIGNISDIVLNIILVLVLDFGVAGAAISTILGQVITILLYTPALFGKFKNTVRIRLQRINFREVLDSFQIGFSSSVQYIGQLFFFVIVNNILMKLEGENGVAVFDVLQNMSYMVMYVYEGAVKALQPIVSTFCGERNETGKRTAFGISLFYGNIAVFVLIMLIAVFPQFICMLFGVQEAEAIALGSRALRIYCVGALIGGTCMIIEGYEQACDHMKKAYLLTILRGGAVLFPCIFLCAMLGRNFVWWFFPLTEWLSLGIYLIASRFLSKKDEKKRSEDENDESRVFRKTIEGQFDDISELIDQMDLFCEQWDCTPKQTMIVNLVAEEVCSAIIREGFAKISDGYIQLTLIALPEGEFEFHIRDNAVQFNPFALEDKKVKSDEDDFDVSAIGIMMIRKRVKSFFYRQYQGFNSLVIKV